MGYHSYNDDEKTIALLKECEELVISHSVPRYSYKIFDIATCDSGINVLGTKLILTGEDIKLHLKDCYGIVLMCATLSYKIDELIRRTQIEDMAKAVVINSLSSVAIEQICNMAEEDIKEAIKDCYLTYRYGVGYGDFPLEHEKDILDIIDAMKNIGLCVTDGNILTPLKSVVCVIGISDTVLEKGQKGCATCNMNKHCQYRKQGLNCGQ